VHPQNKHPPWSSKSLFTPRRYEKRRERPRPRLTHHLLGQVCPYAHRVSAHANGVNEAFSEDDLVAQAEIALAEAKANYKRFEINLQNKPEWCVQRHILLRAHVRADNHSGTPRR
jgi:hypothetical protein